MSDPQLPPEHDDYLWDPSAEPDAELAALEASLQGFAYAGALPPLPAQLGDAPRGGSGWTALLVAGLLAATGLVSAGIAAWSTTAPRPSWELVALHEPQPEAGRLVQGEWLETGAGRYRVQVANLGQVDVEPQSRVRLVETGPDAHRLELARGTLHAVVTAPPRLFVVDTPAAKAVDLGCAYTLEVDAGGDGMLEVTAGAVSLEAARAVYVPAGARCSTWRGGALGTPVFVDAEPLFLEALGAVDTLLLAPEGSVEQLKVLKRHLQCLLPLARIEDSLSLIHLLPNLSPGLRPLLVTRLQDLAPLPGDVSEDAILALEPEALEAWQDSMEWFWGG